MSLAKPTLPQQASNLIWCHCRVCAFSWAIAKLPMPMEEAGMLMQRGGRHCPSCGDTQGARIGKAPEKVAA